MSVLFCPEFWISGPDLLSCQYHDLYVPSCGEPFNVNTVLVVACCNSTILPLIWAECMDGTRILPFGNRPCLFNIWNQPRLTTDGWLSVCTLDIPNLVQHSCKYDTCEWRPLSLKLFCYEWVKRHVRTNAFAWIQVFCLHKKEALLTCKVLYVVPGPCSPAFSFNLGLSLCMKIASYLFKRCLPTLCYMNQLM